MPDNADYEDLARLIANPRAWTPEEAAYMRDALANQLDAVAACHARDFRRRREMTAVAEDIEAAIRHYDDTR